MAQNRIKRVLLPLGVSWVGLFPLTVLSAAITMLGGPSGIAHVVQQLHSGALLARNSLTFPQLVLQLGLIHLWFLYFLVLFYGAITLVVLAMRRLPQPGKDWVDRLFQHLVRHPAGFLLLAAVTWVTMVPMRPAYHDATGIEGTNAFLPPPAILLAHFVFFVFGWLLFRHKHLLGTLRQQAWGATGLGLATAGGYAFLILHPAFANSHLLQLAAAAPAIWLVSRGVIGLALRYMQQPSELFRYLSEASYWVYLVHLPLTLLLPGLLIGVALPALLKFLLVCAGTIGISLLSYQYWVRTTRLGHLLNGRRLAPYAWFGRFRPSGVAPAAEANSYL
ncbi:hypothetical protein GCM10027346_38800 [Hymenobacter seoulensis]